MMKHRGSPGLTASQLLPAQPLPRSQALLWYAATIKSRLNYARVAPALSLSPIERPLSRQACFIEFLLQRPCNGTQMLQKKEVIK